MIPIPLAVGPLMFPVLLVLIAAALLAAVSLIDAGIKRRSAWRLVAGGLLGIYPAAVAITFFAVML
jgi:hypothetical protein